MTSKRDELLALAERCEKATKGSRELDAEIYKAAIGLGMYETIYDRDGDLCIRDYPGPPGPDYRRLPRFSTSLDAAMTLVPNGFMRAVGSHNENNQPWACVTEPDGQCRDYAATGADEVFALCAAALLAAAIRAAAEMEE